MTENQALEILFDICDNKGWEWIMSRQASEHESEKHLLYCVVINQKNEAVSYLFNAKDKAFYSGSYYNDTIQAMLHCENR